MSARLSSSRSRTPTSTRPISSHRGTGFNGNGLRTPGGSKVISPLDHVAQSFSQFLKENSNAPEHKVKEFKKKIMICIQESSKLIANGDPTSALTKAKEAETEMKAFQDFITSVQVDEAEFKSVKFTVIMQLVDAYKANSMWEDAIHRYQRLLKDREFPHPPILYLEIGNIYANIHVRKYKEAIQHYEMGIVHFKPDSDRLQARFNYCCGVAHLLNNCDYSKALACFERSMQADPSIKTGFNLVLCHSVLSPYEVLKDSYIRLLSVKPQMSLDELSNSDILGNQLHVERRDHVRLVMLASRLVAQKGPGDWQTNYEFVLNQLKKSKYLEAAGEFEVAFSLAYLNHKNANKAIEMLRQIRKKDPQLMALAATNLSFLYFLEQDIENAEKYADIALTHDKYNAQALVNKGNCLMQNGHDEEARDSYLEAIGVEADCVEALYNLGIVSKVMGSYNEALQVFEKLNRIIERSPEVDFEISDCFEKMGLIPNAIDWLHRLLNIMPTDPAAWRRLGAIWDKDGNETQAFHCYTESFKFCPSDIEVISWLGSYYRKHQHFDLAIEYFMRAAELLPKEPRYPMFVASCYRNLDMKKEALEIYEKVLTMDSFNKACLESLIKLTTEMGLTQKAEHYQTLLQDLNERLQQLQEEEMQAQMEQNQGMGFGQGFGDSNDFGFRGGNGMGFNNGNNNQMGMGMGMGMGMNSQNNNQMGMGMGMNKMGMGMDDRMAIKPMNGDKGFGNGGFGSNDDFGFDSMENRNQPNMMAPQPFGKRPEKVDAPGLRFGQDSSDMVQRGRAEENALWEGVDMSLPE